jgi:mRNA interferase HigB
MHIISRKQLRDAATRFTDSKKELEAWYKVVSKAEWRTFQELRQTFADADAVREYVVFNIRGNRYRLIAIVHYMREYKGQRIGGRVFIRAVLTHKEYQNQKNWNKGVKQ